MAFAWAPLRGLLRDKAIGHRVVPMIPDEAPHVRHGRPVKDFKIYAPLGQLYEPVDSKLMLSYSEAKDGHRLEEGITEAGGLADFTAAGTAYATFGQAMVPFYTFYSMFGFQRVGDLIWAAADMRARGFLMGATAGRTTLLGEGLQDDDGQSYLLFSVVPNVQAYDPAFAYETAAIVRGRIRRMYCEGAGEDVFYYITLYNENDQMPAKPEGADEGILRGLYRFELCRAEPAGHGPFLRLGQPGRPTGAEAAGRGPRCGRRAMERHQLQGPAGGCPGGGAPQPAPPLQSPRTPFVSEALAQAEGPSWP